MASTCASTLALMDAGVPIKKPVVGIAMGLARITKAVLHNQNVVLTVSTLLQGEYGEENVYIGVPAVIHRTGVSRVIHKPLDADESERFARSAALLRSYNEKIQTYLK